MGLQDLQFLRLRNPVPVGVTLGVGRQQHRVFGGELGVVTRCARRWGFGGWVGEGVGGWVGGGVGGWVGGGFGR